MARLRWACGTGVNFSLRSVIGPQVFMFYWGFLDPGVSTSYSACPTNYIYIYFFYVFRTSLIEKRDARALCEKHEKTWERSENLRWPSGMRGRAFLVILGVFWGWKIMFFENLDFLIKNVIFRKVVFYLGESITSEGQGRFRRSQGST